MLKELEEPMDGMGHARCERVSAKPTSSWSDLSRSSNSRTPADPKTRAIGSGAKDPRD